MSRWITEVLSIFWICPGLSDVSRLCWTREQSVYPGNNLHNAVWKKKCLWGFFEHLEQNSSFLSTVSSSASRNTRRKWGGGGQSPAWEHLRHKVNVFSLIPQIANRVCLHVAWWACVKMAPPPPKKENAEHSRQLHVDKDENWQRPPESFENWHFITLLLAATGVVKNQSWGLLQPPF